MSLVTRGLGGYTIVTSGLGRYGVAVSAVLRRMRFQSREPAMTGVSRTSDQSHVTVEIMRKVE